MIIDKNKLSARLFFLIIFFSFIGYYVCLLVFINLGLMSASRFLTIPLRLLVVACLWGVFILRGHYRLSKSTLLFLFFVLIYFARIVIEVILDKSYYLSTDQLILFFLSFSVIPFLFVNNSELKPKDFDIALKSLLISSLLFSILSSFFYSKFIGTVGRLSRMLVEEEVLSPLALSYCSVLTIGVSLSYLLDNKTTTKTKFLIVVIIAFSAIPFFLGASRGSLLSLFLPFLFIVLTKRGAASNFKILFVSILFIFLIIFLSNLLGSSIVDRFSGISEDIEEGSSSAIRTEIWEMAISQFIDNPLLGDGLAVKGVHGHPHNAIVEVFLSTGIIGGLPFIFLIFLAFWKSSQIIKDAPAYSWVVVVFVQSFIQHLFSGALHSASWLWLSMAMIFTFNLHSLKNESQMQKT